MSTVWLVRHGQAGTRQEYDALSETGRRQARLLGEYLAAQKTPFRAAVAGALRRQRETAEETAWAAREAGLDFPAIEQDAGWNEFDLETVYREIAPAIAAGDAAFAAQYAALMRQAEDRRHSVHRTWSGCDAAIVKAWIEGRHPASCESWAEFTARIRSRAAFLPECGEGEAVAVFTSAAPVAVWVALALGALEERIMPLAGVMHNTAVSMFRVRGGGLALLGFNGVPHLPEPALRTLR